MPASSALSFRLNGQPLTVTDAAPTTTLLDWLRASGRTGSKEGCAEGDCGACSVALLDPDAPQGPTWRAVCSCILLLPQVADRELVTVEGLAEGGQLHPAQQAMVEALGSQCGYCTPGFVMSVFEGCYRRDLDEGGVIERARRIDDQLCGNLCRCTGYRPIREALEQVAGRSAGQAGGALSDRFAARLDAAHPAPGPVDLTHAGQRFLRPTTWPQLWEALSEGAAPRFINGATDLGLNVTKRHETWPLLVDLSALPGMRRLEPSDAGWTLGAGALLADLEDLAQAELPALAAVLRYFGSRQIKNRATLGGNLCNASPIGDLAPALLAYDAVAVLRSAQGERRLPLSEFFVGYRRTALAPGELLYAIELPRPQVGALHGAYKVSKRRELDISAVCGAFYVSLGGDGRVTEARLGYGGVAATPARAARAEAALLGAPWSEAAIEAAAAALSEDFTPLSDHRGSAWYRAQLAQNLLRRFYAERAPAEAP